MLEMFKQLATYYQQLTTIYIMKKYIFLNFPKMNEVHPHHQRCYCRNGFRFFASPTAYNTSMWRYFIFARKLLFGKIKNNFNSCLFMSLVSFCVHNYFWEMKFDDQLRN